MDIYLHTDELQVCVLSCIKPVYTNYLPPVHADVARVKFIRIEADGAINQTEMITTVGFIVALIVSCCCSCFLGARFCRRKDRYDI
jgi:hypothetical protein